MDEIIISRLKWLKLLCDLNFKGEGRRESGAFLLGKKGSRKVCHYICYDELYEDAFSSGYIVLERVAWVRLWDFCSKNKMQVLADIHTHPSEWTAQSPSDMQNPLVSQAGHIAMIAPCYAKYWWRGLRGIGIHEYKGSNRWQGWSSNSGKVRFVLL